MKLNIWRRARKRLPARVKQALFVPEEANLVWSVDFTAAGGGGHDRLWDGGAFRLLNVIGEAYTGSGSRSDLERRRHF